MKANYRISLRVIAAVLLFALLTAGATLPAAAEVNYPTASDNLADEAGILSESTVKYLRETNQKLADQISAVIAICTVKTTDGVDIGKYARGVYSKWGLPAGILLTIAAEDDNFYLLPSTSVSEVVGTEALEAIRDEYLEADFADKQYDRAVKKAITQISSVMLDKMKSAAPAENTETAAEPKTEKSSVGSVIVKVLKTILIIALVLVVLFVILFVIALFNDDVAAFMQKYIFRRGRNAGAQNQGKYYDERLYGDQNADRRRPQNPNNRPQNPNGRPQNRAPRTANPSMRQQNPNAAPGQVYYNADGTVRTPAPRRPQGYPQQNGQYPQQQYPQQNAQYPQQNVQSMDGNATRAYTIVPKNNDN